MTLHSSSHREQIVSALACPAWCTEIADHGSGVPNRPAVWERSHWAHVATLTFGLPEEARPVTNEISVVISQYAGADETEVTVLPPAVWVFELDNDTPLPVEAARRLAAALLNAADLAESDVPTASIPVQTAGGAR